ncbi:MAG: 30S ribosomal protein S7 [Firmicutes bacterium]|nr:30S ribosomal protein S7 [Bacillota bacterium]MCL5038568.1 30S ribosomal protein S7 [Bacillota bacterium]
MPRRGQVSRREIDPDPVYQSEMAARFINNLMQRGKKALAQRIFYDAMEIVKSKTGKEPLSLFEQALKNVTPLLEVRPRRVGGATYQVPMEVRPDRRISLSIRWLIRYARTRGERTMEEKLAGELLDAANNTGGAVKKKEETHKMAEANKAFAHYRW